MTSSSTLKTSPNSAAHHEAADLAQITAILKRALSGKSCTAYLFGSRATGAAQPASDFDVAVFATEDISRELSLARDMLEESNIPFKVDVVDLGATSASFKQAVLQQGVLLWKN